MKRIFKKYVAVTIVLTMILSLFTGMAPVAQAEGGGGAPSLQSPIIGATNSSGTGALVTFNYQGVEGDEDVHVKGSFHKNWGENIPLTEGDNDVWSVSRDVPAGWYQYGIEVGTLWKGDPLNNVMNGTNPGLSVPGVSFNAPKEFATNSATVVSAVYFTGNLDATQAVVLSVEDATGVSIQDGKLVVADNAELGPAKLIATYGGFTATYAIEIVDVMLQSPVINGDGTVTFNNKSHTGDTLYLFGKMNEWNNTGIEMNKGSDGIFSVTRALTPGSYEYKFIPVSGSSNNAFTDPLNLKIANTNSVVHVHGIKIISANDIEKGTSIPLTAELVNTSGEVSQVTPTWSLEENKTGVTLSNAQLSVASDYVVTEGDFVTVVAKSGSYTFKKKIYIKDIFYTFNIHYYRYDEQMENWDNWIFNDFMGGTEYDFTGTDLDGFRTVQVKLPYTFIKTIQRPGNFSSQDLQHTISIPDGEVSVDAWILEGKPEVYFDRDAALVSKADVPIKRYVELRYVRPDQDYTDWNLWVWSTGAKIDRIDFYKIEDGVASARIEIGKETSRMGFKIRKGEWEAIDVDTDRFVVAPLDQIITKATVTSGQMAIEAIPSLNGPSLADGAVTLFYRDEALYNDNLMNTISSVKMKVTLAGQTNEYAMVYHPSKEYYEYTLSNLQEGIYTYSFLVTKDDITTEKNDPKNTNAGTSTFEYRHPAVEVTGTLSPRAIASNENAVLSVNLTSDEVLQYREIYMNLTSLGGAAKVPIDVDLREGTLGVTDSISAGDKTIPITAVDIYGNKHNGTATVTVKPRQEVGALDFDWDEARIYFLLTDRFYDGDASNNENVDKSHPEAYHGGDFQGVIDKLDYLKDLGTNTIWVTPIVDNIDFNQGATFGGKQYGYTGYWAQNFEKLDEHLGDLETFKQLIDTAHDKGMKIMVDVVLGHTGYGLKPGDTNTEVSQENKDRLAGMLRTDGVDSGKDEIKGEIAGLPDFKTEDPAVRAKLIEWQTSWLERAKTDRGDTIDYFRVDTIKHVDDTTWKAFKNSLTQINPEFKLIGEYFGASIDAQGGALRTGQMDSLLDFDFNNRAEKFVKGGIDEVESYLEYRNALMDNTATMGHFLSSHDEDGFLSDHINGDKGMLKVAAALQITAKGQPVIYYGEELGQSGKNGGDFAAGMYSKNRDDMPWSKLTDVQAVEEQALHQHYTKLLNIRDAYSKVFSKGTRTKVAGGDSEGYLVFDRAFKNEHVLVGLNTTIEATTVTFNVPFAQGHTIVDKYNTDKTYTVNNNGQVTVLLPGRDQGGTIVLVDAGVNTPSEPTNPGTGPGSSPGSSPAPSTNTGTTTISEAALKGNATDGIVSINIPNISNEGGRPKAKILLPANAASLVGDNAVQLRSDYMTIVLPQSVLSALQNMVEGELSKSQISMSITAVPSQESDSLIKQAASTNGVDLNLVGTVYEFELAIVDSKGKEKQLTIFEEPITLTFAVDTNANKDLLGVYYIANSGTLEFVGGTFQNGQIVAQVDHFSKYGVLEYNKSFEDVKSDFWGAQDIKVMAAKHIVNGKTVNTFDPNGDITRAEFAALLMRALGIQTSSDSLNPFTDVVAGQWYTAEVVAAYDAKLVSGMDATHFNPNGKITREEMAVMTARALKKQGKTVVVENGLLEKYSDSVNVNVWANEGIQISLQTKIMQGISDSELQPSNQATRATAVVVLKRMMEYVGLLNS
jgi:glycosidase